MTSTGFAAVLTNALTPGSPQMRSFRGDVGGDARRGSAMAAITGRDLDATPDEDGVDGMVVAVHPHLGCAGTRRTKPPVDVGQDRRRRSHPCALLLQAVERDGADGSAHPPADTVTH